METSELIKKVRKIEIKTKGLSKHIFSGEYHSAFKGRGMSFSEVREYQYGDDVRNIDWNVTARANQPYVKIYEEERELTVMLVVDVSKSSFFGTVNQFKSEIITEISAVISFSAINNNDKVGVIFFSDKVEQYIPPKKGKQHILRIIRELINFTPSGKGTQIHEALDFMNNVIKKRCTCFILSDFMTKDYSESLRIAKKRHDIIGLHIYDQREESLPNVGLLKAADAETGKVIYLDTASKAFRQAYEKRFQDNQTYFQNTFLKCGADVVNIRTDESYINALMKFFKKRHG
ncbi:MAG: DUF58 domain-containing protein [Flavobacteriales bacterium]|nr:DUF58 domain-containing protein [Flavobacteriales bacterium]